MDKYKLIDLDQMEASVVRRRLRHMADEQAIRSLIVALQQEQCLLNIHIKEPRCETNVYPLYYYWAHHQGVSHKEVYDRVFESLPTDKVSLPGVELRAHVTRVVDSEIDILIEDIDYFVFIEAKFPKEGQKAKFEPGVVHQLIRQYVEGRILAKLISKKFVLATIGANNGQHFERKLNPTERALLQLVDEDEVSLQVIDLSWPPLIAVAQAGE